MSGPTLDQYPGYYPAGSKPFWSRWKVGVVAGITGLLIGVVGSGSEAEAPAEPEASNATEVATLQADLDEALSKNDELGDQLTSERQEATSAASDASRAAVRAQKKAVRAAVAKTRRVEQQKTAAAVAAAKREVAASLPTSPVAPVPAPATSTDQQYSYCYEANAAGLGPYYQGQDPEYDWYDDRDGDGVVCEY